MPKIEIKYIENEGWTVPCFITGSRIDKFLNDESVEKIRLTFSDGSQRIFKAV